MENFDLHTIISGGSVAVNLYLALMTTRMKLELAEIKVWILENFERRAEK